MPDQTNAEYFKMRAPDERKRSNQATDPRAAAAHAAIAERYDEMAALFEGKARDPDQRLGAKALR